MTKVVDLHKKLITEWKKDRKDLVTVEQCLEAIKIELLNDQFMPASSEEKSNVHIEMHRNILEIAVLLAVLKRDLASFERAIVQLRHYYTETKALDSPPSGQVCEMLGLHLMYLLCQHRLSEFHTVLEMLPRKLVETDVHISNTVKLEQYLMEGAYNKANVPSQNYHFFMDILLETVRGEIATCMEKAYDKLRTEDAARLLFFNEQATAAKVVLDYGKKRAWKLSSDKKSFTFQDTVKKQDNVVQSEALVKNNIFYAKQLEMIV